MQPNDLLPAAHQNNAIDYAPEEVDLPDVALVNPGGRVIEVPGAQAQELLMQMGYRRATEEEAAQIEAYKKRTHPDILKRAEMQRVRERKAEVDALEREIAGEETAPVAPAPETSAAEPAEDSPKPRSRK